MIPILIALAFAVHPPSIALAANPGDTVTIPLTMVGEDTVKMSGSGIIDYDETIIINGKQSHNVTFRIPPSTSAGAYTSLLYVAPDSDEFIVPATAVKVETTVSRGAGSRLIAGTNKVLQPSFIPVLIALVVAGLCVVAALSIRVRRV